MLPISFDMRAILKERYYNIGNESKYLVQTCSQAKDSGIKLPDIYSINKGINPYIKPEKTGTEVPKCSKKVQARAREIRPQKRNESPNTRTSAN